MNKIALTMCCIACAGGLMAQEMSSGDLAAQLAAQADAAAKLLPGVPTEGVNSAEEVVKANLAKLGVAIGYDRKRQAVISIGTAELLIKDPANEKSFMLYRLRKANEAYLSAKANVIRAIYSELTAVDRVEMTSQFGDLEKAQMLEKPTADYDKRRRELDEKRAELVRKLGQLDQSEAAMFEGVTVGDRFNAVLEGLAKKLDTKFSAEKIAADKRELRDSLKAECAALRAECEALEQEAKEIIPPVPIGTHESNVKLLSRMPLLGSSVLTQAESWNEIDGKYQVSMAIIWSPKMQESAVALLTNEAVPSMKKGRFTPQEWAARQNFATMLGPRRFTDSEGNNIFVGIAAVDLTGQISHQRGKKSWADLQARKFVAFSLTGDLESFEEAAGSYKEFGDENQAAMEKYSQRITAKCDTVLQGCTQLSVQTVKHPITGRDTYVSAYYVDPALAKDAGELLKKAYAGAMRQAEATKKLRAEKLAYEEALKREREEKAKAAAAAAKARAELEAEKVRQTKLAAERRRELERQEAEAKRQRAAAEAREREIQEARAKRLAAIKEEQERQAAAARARNAQLEEIRKANENRFYQSMGFVGSGDSVDPEAVPD